MNTIAERIISARKAKNLNQSELARALKVTPQAVQSWEVGKSQPKGPRIEALANILGVSVQYLITGMEAQRTQSITDKFSGLFLDEPTESQKQQARLSATLLSATQLATEQIDESNSKLRDSLADLDLFRKIQDPSLMISVFYITAAATENGLTPEEKEQLANIAMRIKNEPLGYLEYE